MSKHYLDSQVNSVEVTVLGIGNILMRDEGVGIHVIQSLEKSYTFSSAVKFIDGGTTGLDLIPYFEEAKKMIIIDAVDFQEDPGYVGMLYNEDIYYKFNTKLSLHHAGLADVLSIIQLKDIPAPDMMLVGIQPLEVKMGMELSNTIDGKMDDVISIIIDKLKEWGIDTKHTSA